MYSLPDRRRRAAVRPSPVFLGAVGVTAVGGVLAWTSHTLSVARLAVFAFVLGGWVVSLCLHEFGHAYAAYRGGDRSVEAAGYLTLNPLKYVHKLYSIILPLVFIVLGGIGLPGGAVYLNRSSIRSRAALSVAALAGPVFNVGLGAILLTVARSERSQPDHVVFWAALAFLGFLQISAALLNLLPIPGLDGYAILEPYLDPATARAFEPAKAWGMIAVFVLIQVGQLNNAFFNLVNRICELFGCPDGLAYAGRELFRFWVKL